MSSERVRIDQLILGLGLVESREQGRRLIMAGEVLVNGQLVDRPATQVLATATVEIKARPPYVSRGGEKLLTALTEFELDVTGAICADVGASTGGFTDCLLQHGAAKVYAIDVGSGILHYKLRTDARVVVMEKTNARYLESLPEPVQLVVCDAAFISITLLLPTMRSWLAPNGQMVVLVKPQFEVGPDQVGKGGVVRQPALHRQAILTVLTAAAELALAPTHLAISPLKGPAGNHEFLLRLVPGVAQPTEFEALLNTVPHLIH